MYYTCHYQSPLGGITMACDEEGLTGLWFDGQKYFGAGLPDQTACGDTPVFAETRRWLLRYFAGEAPGALPPLRLTGSPFRQAVWALLLCIPYGRVTTYGEIAAALARQRDVAHLSAQAVGGAVGHNPVSILVPCHRVVGSGGSLTGYAGGLDKKAALLALERADLQNIFRFPE